MDSVFVDPDELKTLKGDEVSIQRIDPGPLVTTLHETAIERGHASDNLNCDIDSRVFRLDKRRRQFQASPLAGIAMGLGFGEYGDCAEFLAVQAEDIFSIDADETSNIDGSITSNWNDLTPPAAISSLEDFIIWQYERYFFFASEGRFFQKEICEDPVREVGRTVFLPGGATFGFDPPPYDREDFAAADTIVGSSSAANLTIHSDTVVDGNIHFDAEWIANFTGLARLIVTVTFNTAKDWSNRGYLGIYVKGNSLTTINPNDTTPLNYLKIWKTGATGAGQEQNARVRSYPTAVDTMGGWADITTITSDMLAAVKKIEFEVAFQSRRGRGLIVVEPFALGGSYLNQYDFSEKIDGDQILPVAAFGPHTEPIEYGFRYKHDSSVFSDLYKFQLDGGANAALGNPAFAIGGGPPVPAPWYQPFLGAWVSIVVPQNLTGGFVAGDTIEIYRKIQDDWYLLASGANGAAGLTHVDKLTSYYIRNNITPTPGLNLGGIDPTTLDGITFGCAWKGCNVIFRDDGLVNFSKPNEPTRWLLEGVVVPGYVIGAPDDPVTFYATRNQGLPIISAVPLGPLFMWSRKEGYVIVGELPAEASFPILISPNRGVVGKRASNAYRQGAVFGSDDGLWYITYDEALAGDRRTPIPDELTEGIRPTWNWLLGANRSKLVVRAHGDDIWCFCENRFLHRTRNERWIPGQWADNKHVHDAVVDPFRGLVLQMTNGSACVIGDYLTDGGTNADGSNGAPVDWTYRTKVELTPAKLKAIRAVYETLNEKEFCRLEVRGFTDEVPEGQPIGFEKKLADERKAFQTFQGLGGHDQDTPRPLAGKSFWVTLTGSGWTICKRLWIELAGHSARY